MILPTMTPEEKVRQMEKMKPLLHEAAMGWMNRNYKTVRSMATICSTGWPKILIVRALNHVACDYTGASILYIRSWVLKLGLTFIITVWESLMQAAIQFGNQ